MKTSWNMKGFLLFILPSFFGVFLFMVPIRTEDGYSIPVAILANSLQIWLSPILPGLLTALIVISALISAYATIRKPVFFSEKPNVSKLVVVSPFWLVVRLIGAMFAVVTFFTLADEAIIEVTGGLLLYDLMPVLFTVFLFAGFFLPLLLNFGLLELCGALLNPLMRPLFKLPGRSAIDSLASWMGDGTVGVMLTNQQYEQGYYSEREAAVIGTTFSVVSITFSIVILDKMDLMNYVLPYYGTIVLAGFIAAIIMPRIPPLSRKKERYYTNEPSVHESRPATSSLLLWGLTKAMNRARNNSVKDLFQKGLLTVGDLWIGVLPVVMAFGTATVLLAETTPLFEWLGIPFVPLLELAQIPEAIEASKTMLVGFADMFLPAILGSEIESELTRFVIACLSVTQLIYMSEVGGLLLASKLPIRFIDLVLIFLERTIITLPIIIMMAHLIF
ncbi:YjiH family protein [Halalkalibacterium halodurans]|uniref:BH2250 protein n=1 Tax=Halalkalibacterium halodurans (strain ATCC BAA-125 / DSM 18197 / FERM 7344 / JCM 9153 / C-125) TaxID=272558 RepID=Q9KAN7_HALH5|nr:YjiH family protein [Halalkalibacterium halodurans]MED3645718.1 YjiH family protein [Halalkalibacterium halodurans]MED4126096.1 YjiH family protein [Halalkalibacterium halodurans]MED4163907.1 YjiH family protein [Halalkalibacterium halodurans]MED4171284.1 YjiH family protein [Halalkalibacterium halodurans]BAB05969.1 BH2250 [Halalkalibacterium halodurans C-125]